MYAYDENYEHLIVLYYGVFSQLCNQIVQMHGVYSATYGTVHYKESFKSFEIEAQSRLRASFCRDIAMIVQKAKESNFHSFKM